jgi:hypothetical protein
MSVLGGFCLLDRDGKIGLSFLGGLCLKDWVGMVGMSVLGGLCVLGRRCWLERVGIGMSVLEFYLLMRVRVVGVHSFVGGCFYWARVRLLAGDVLGRF